MATYEYKCKNCEKTEEAQHPMGKAPDEMKCSECGCAMKRIFSPPFIKFRGPGFHSTDYGAGTIKGKD